MMKERSTRFSLLVLRAANVEASLAFYRALGLTFIQEQHGSGPVHHSCDANGMVLEIYPDKANSSQEALPHTTMLGFKVASLVHTLEKLRLLGVEPKTAPKESEWGRWVNVTDPDGRTIQLNEATA